MDFDPQRWQSFSTIQLIALVNHKVKTLAKQPKPVALDDALAYARALVDTVEVFWVISVRMSNRLSKIDPGGMAE